MALPTLWYGMKYPDSNLVSLLFKFARPTNTDDTAIDVGCGPGRHCRLLEDMGYQVIGIDSEPRMCATASKNGIVDVRCISFDEFDAPPNIGLAVCWGLTMCSSRPSKHVAESIAAWQASLVILDWRSKKNSSYLFRDNTQLLDGGMHINNSKHILFNQDYYYVDETECQLPGYDRLYLRKVTVQKNDEVDEWYQSVHQLKDLH